jgi:hypothetical protein
MKSNMVIKSLRNPTHIRSDKRLTLLNPINSIPQTRPAIAMQLRANISKVPNDLTENPLLHHSHSRNNSDEGSGYSAEPNDSVVNLRGIHI